MKTRILLLFTLLCAAMTSLQGVHAVTITVMNTNDSGAGSLRAALISANDGDTIDFQAAVTGTVTLTTGQLVVDKSVVISGPGANNLTVDANHASRVFYVSPSKTVTISGLTITNGSFNGNGGGIYNDHATLTVTNSTLSGNSASNLAGGGGIYNDGGTTTITNSTLSGNSAPVSGGGGINNASGTITITNSTLSGNSAITEGGGISNSGTLTVTNSTLSGNSADISGGGGISNSGTLTVSNSTLSGNSGGGIKNFRPAATLTIGDTILKAGASGANLSSDFGTVTSLGYNLSSDAAGGDGTTVPGGFLNATGDIRNTDPLLGPLQNNGGPTFTHALCTALGVPDASCAGASPAIDAGDPSFTPPPDYDQRGAGFDRVVNSRIDKGAFEVQAPPVCPQPQGYWKNNPDAWPVENLMLGSQTYTKAELLTILRTRIGSGPRADASLILADQLIAAKLNIENGADDPAPVPATITDADTVLSLYGGKLPYRVRPNTTNGQRMVSDANTLNSYNSGLLTTGCSP